MRTLGPWVLLLGVLGLALAQRAAPDFTRFYPYEEARALAEEHDRVLLLYFRSLHCPYCEQMETFVLAEPEVLDLFARCYVVGMVTLERPDGPPRFRAHQVAGTPVFIWMAPADGAFRELGRVFGSMPKARFLEYLKRYCEEGEDEPQAVS